PDLKQRWGLAFASPHVRLPLRASFGMRHSVRAPCEVLGACSLLSPGSDTDGAELGPCAVAVPLAGAPPPAQFRRPIATGLWGSRSGRHQDGPATFRRVAKRHPRYGSKANRGLLANRKRT